MNISMKTGLVALLLAVAGGNAFAKEVVVLKWTDEHGRTHYGDQPPAKQDATEVRIRVPQAAKGSQAVQEAILQVPEACQQALDQLAVLDGDGPVHLKDGPVDAQGQPVPLDEETRKAHRQVADLQVKLRCAGTGIELPSRPQDEPEAW